MPLSVSLFAVYIGLAWVALYAMPRQARARLVCFALLNVVTFVVMVTQLYGMRPKAVLCYLTVMLAQYALLRHAQRTGRFWLPLLFPIAIMIISKGKSGLALVGISYLAFRLSYLALEVKDKSIALPDFCSYLAFACFPPLLAVGPIVTMKVFSDSLATPGANRLTLGDAVLRIVIGVLKFQVLAALFNTLAPTALLQDFHRHTMVDLVVSSVAYYGYLYCNFSGYTDVVIGMAGVLGITLEENFAQPYFARNIQEFWQRWHITLARYMRDMVYFPLVKTLTKRFGRRRYNAVVVLAIFVTFTLTGLWHGFALNFLYYGLLHAAGLICHFLYSTALKARLGPRITAYNANPYIRIAATALTFAYLCFTFYFFANKANQLGLIMQAFS